jgi:PAS domain S-box-containing protein
MSLMNHDLLASHRIIAIMEKARSLTEDMISSLPDILMNITRAGEILKINDAGARHFSVNRELILGISCQQLFQKETWNIFESKLEYVSNTGQLIDFELPIDCDSGKRMFFYWTISLVRKGNHPDDSIYSVIGRDISALRQQERSLAEMFSSIPLGILTIGADCKIETPYFAYCEHLLSRTGIGGENLLEILFNPCANHLTSEQKEGLSNLSKFYRSDYAVFEAIVESFPKRLQFPITTPLGEDVRHIGISYQPIVYQNEVRRLMVVLEDRTAITKFEKDRDAREQRNSKVISRILQIKNSDPTLLPDMVADTDRLLKVCQSALDEGKLDTFTSRLHGAKGNANMAGFFNLVDLSHALEKDILKNQVDIEGARDRFVDVMGEWRQLVALYNALEAKDPMLEPTAGDMNPWPNFERKLKRQIEIIGQKLGKKTEFEFVCHLPPEPQATLDQLREMSIHLINNALDHGIEKPDERILVSKPSVGRIRVELKAYKGGVLVEVADDGRGLNLQKIRDTAVAKGHIPKDIKLTDQEIMNLIFARELSTADQVTEVSGRGIGLDAVKTEVEKKEGWIKVARGEKYGTIFTIFIPGL